MKKTNARKAQRPRIVYSKCRALIPLDTAKIRKKELAKLNRHKDTCTALDAELERFEKEEKKAYEQWIQTHCGPAIVEYRTIRAEATLLENTLDLVFDLMAFYPNRTRQACAEAAVVYFETNGTIPEGFEAFFNPSFDGPEFASDPFGDDDDDYDEDDEFMDEFAESLRDFESLIEDMLNGAESEPGRKHAPRSDHRRERKAIKELYRRIARRLHPDGAGGTTPGQLELWHAAQAAYENHDRETLERIDARCDLLDAESTRSAPVSSIQKSIAFYKNACAQFRRAIRNAKRLPEWGFLNWSEKKRQRVLKAHQQEIASEIQYVSRMRNECKNQLEKMRKPPAPLKRNPPNKKTPSRKPASAMKPEPQNDDQGLFDFF